MERFGASGGYRKTWSFALTCLVYHATTLFCRRNFDYRHDPLGKASGQMIGAARSARQNIVEGSRRGATSKAQEVLQYDVARGSLDELAGDYEAFLIDNGVSPWSEQTTEAKTVSSLKVDKFEVERDLAHQYGEYILLMRRRFSSWLENEDPLVAAQSILITIRRAMAMLRNQMESIDSANGDEKTCPQCGAPMKLRLAKKGPSAGKQFWSCSRYPTCKGLLPA